MRIVAAITKPAASSGMPSPSSVVAMKSPIPEAASMPPNAPPAAVIAAM